MMPSKPSSSGKALDKTLDISITIIKRLEEVSKLTTPLPFITPAAGLALAIFGAVKNARDNKAGFKELADETCRLVYEVTEIYPKDGALSPKLSKDLNDLVLTLDGIKDLTTKEGKRRTIVRFFSCLLTSNSDADEIAKYRKKVEKAFQEFGFRSNVAIREDTAAIKADTHEILQELKQQGDAGTPPAPAPPTCNIVTNTNSGNTTTTTLNNSNNDFSVRAPGAPKNRRKPVTVPKPPPVPPVFVAPMVIDPMANAFTGRAGRANYFGSNITTNTNSGNTTTTTITNSGNDYSSRTYGGHRSFHSPPPSPRSPNFYRGNSMSSR